jgi:hypothetical protein
MGTKVELLWRQIELFSEGSSDLRLDLRKSFFSEVCKTRGLSKWLIDNFIFNLHHEDFYFVEGISEERQSPELEPQPGKGICYYWVLAKTTESLRIVQRDWITEEAEAI